MKQYIKAAYDPSMPEWLRKELSIKKGFNSNLKDWLNDEYDMGNAKFYDSPQEGSIVIELLYDVYESDHYDKTDRYYKDTLLFIPNAGYMYDDYWIESGKGYRRVATAAQSKLKNHIVDITYMVAPARSASWSDRSYVDPRYTRFGGTNGRRWGYQGQYPEYYHHWDSDLRRSVRDTEPTSWNTRGNYNEKRDKSGYIIPKPADLYNRLYQRFPDRTQGKFDAAKAKLEECYEKLEETKTKIFNYYDIRNNKYISTYGNTVFSNFNSAISEYCQMCRELDACVREDGIINNTNLSAFLNGGRYNGIGRCAEIDRRLVAINNELERGY